MNAPTNSRKKLSIWKFDITNPVYDHACAAMETRPDYPEIERLWEALDERFKSRRYEYDPSVDDDPLYEIDIAELSEEAQISDEACLSHLRTLWGAGMIRALATYEDIRSVSVLISPHWIAKSASPEVNS